ncbi:hypothetical protein IWQ62_006218 [Dispira parvispora]|uniref:Uncharacterized protein n=1 Tax=Dispira parvispora TaxID=1520584 RepID=A0A9W8APH8_9FUNG|nr:hypothetical protein IWQ62_006218 [Dispira parvispora]
MSDISRLTQDVIYQIHLGIDKFTGDLDEMPWRTWLINAEKSIEDVLPNPTDQAKYLVTRQLLDPLIVKQLSREEVDTWQGLVQSLNRRYPHKLWRQHYASLVNKKTIFQGLKIDDAIPVATAAVKHLGITEYWINRVVKSLREQYQNNLGSAPPSFWNDELWTMEQFQERMGEIREHVIADQAREQEKQDTVRAISPGHQQSGKTPMSSPQQPNGPAKQQGQQNHKSGGKKKSSAQKWRERHEQAEKEIEELRKQLAGKE